MSNLSVFNFESHEIRLVGTADDPWWVAADVCKILGIGNPSDAIARLDPDEFTLFTIEGASNGLPVNVINESGLYSLVLTSRKAQAKRFKKWLTSEVIPAIRKTGSYSAITTSQQQSPTSNKAKLAEHHAKVESIRQKITATDNTFAKKEALLAFMLTVYFVKL